MNSNDVILHLSLIDGIGAGTIEQLITNKPWDLDLQDLYQMGITQIARLFGISWAKAELVCNGLKDLNNLDKERELIERHQINWMTIFHEQYPVLLKNIHMPPAVLYWQGTLPSSNHDCLAVIGSRAMNTYGARAIEACVPPIVDAGFTIVSGGAIGADTAAHKTTLAHGGTTVAILGSGLFRPYPASNRRLFEQIMTSGGAIASPFPLLTTPISGNFPARNRIIAGLSRGCLVVQAAQKSGTHITASYALEQGRELFAIPGPIDDALSAGCHSLIQQGATLVTSPVDILQQLGFVLQKSAAPAKKPVIEPYKADGPSAIILRMCMNSSSIDELAEATELDMPKLYTQLFELEIAGLIAQQANGLWQKV